MLLVAFVIVTVVESNAMISENDAVIDVAADNRQLKCFQVF